MAPFLLQAIMQEGGNKSDQLDQMSTSLTSMSLDPPTTSPDQNMEYVTSDDEDGAYIPPRESSSREPSPDLSEEFRVDSSEPSTIFNDMGKIDRANIVEGKRKPKSHEDGLVEGLGGVRIDMEVDEKKEKQALELAAYNRWAHRDGRYLHMKPIQRQKFEDHLVALEKDPMSLTGTQRRWMEHHKLLELSSIRRRERERFLPTSLITDSKNDRSNAGIKKNRCRITKRDRMRLTQEASNRKKEANGGDEDMANDSPIVPVPVSAMDTNDA
ncbi:uncharacterized protein BP5553_00170 [Venustampulla echinocandica]|uniref:Uncharacterized protein n=1 Tax=Venustampulla echinocandica TaxID=2656787 RepID=A0A370TXD6_9HELO|nr:uncharacterized protein BP5553_00170 [Venustampulla echinocandica]RDL40191.1 hypothetical protein BP5553_00170 [Venustampulla echinocandica]